MFIPKISDIEIIIGTIAKILAIAVIPLIFFITIVLPIIVDLRYFTSQIEGVLSAELGRDVIISGGIHITALPGVRVVIDDASIANIDGFTPHNMVTIGRIGFELAIIPLMHKQVHISGILIEDTEINYSINAKGISNIDDMPIFNKPHDKNKKSAGISSIERFMVDALQINYSNEHTKSYYLIDDVYIDVDDIVTDKTANARMKATLTNLTSKMTLSADLFVTTEITEKFAYINLEKSTLNLNIPNAQLKSTIFINADSSLDLNAKIANITNLKINGAVTERSHSVPFTANLDAEANGYFNANDKILNLKMIHVDSSVSSIKLNDRYPANIDASLYINFINKTLDIDNILLKIFEMSVTAKVVGEHLDTDAIITGIVNINEFSPKNLISKFKTTYKPSNPALLAKANIVANLKYTKNHLNIPVKLQVDNNHISANTAIDWSNAQQAVMDIAVAVNTLNINGYLPNKQNTTKLDDIKSKYSISNWIKNRNYSELPKINTTIKANKLTILRTVFENAYVTISNPISIKNKNPELTFKFDADTVTVIPSHIIKAMVKKENDDQVKVEKEEIIAAGSTSEAAQPEVKNANDLIQINEKDKITELIEIAKGSAQDITELSIKKEDGIASVENASPPIMEEITDDKYAGDGMPDLSSIVPVNASGIVTIKSFSFNKLLINNISSHLSINNGNIAVLPFQAQMFDGNVSINATIHNTYGTHYTSAQLTITDILLDKAISSFSDKDHVISGKLSATAELSSAGTIPYNLLSSLDGTMDYTLRDGILYGIGYNPDMISIDTVKSFLLIDSKKSTKVNDLKGAILFDNGIANLDSVNFTSQYMNGSINGTVILDRMIFDLNGILTLNGKTKLDGVNVPITIKGTRKNPDIWIDQANLIKGLLWQYTSSTAKGILTAPVDIPTAIVEGIGNGIVKTLNWISGSSDNNTQDNKTNADEVNDDIRQEKKTDN